MSRKPMRITITFKESERDLYEELVSHSVPGGYIKDILSNRGEKPIQKCRTSQSVVNKAGFIGIMGDE